MSSKYLSIVLVFFSIIMLSRTAEAGTNSGDLVIIIAGRHSLSDPLQDNLHYVTNAAHNLFERKGYEAEQIYYLATEPTLDANGDQVSDVDATPSDLNLQAAITDWASTQLDENGHLTLYVASHASQDNIYLDKTVNEVLTPDELDAWLAQLELTRPDIFTTIIIDSSYSGSFITKPSEISSPNRIVVTSTSTFELAWASDDGSLFSDNFLQTLDGNDVHVSLGQAFSETEAILAASFTMQAPQIDANGNGIANEEGDHIIAAQHHLFSQTHDSYEPNDICTEAVTIETDGTPQTHTFSQKDDEDWSKFTVEAGKLYTIEAIRHATSPAHPLLTLFTRCGGPPPFRNTGGSTIVFEAEFTGLLYMQTKNESAEQFGSEYAYDLTITSSVPSAISLANQHHATEYPLRLLTLYLFVMFAIITRCVQKRHCASLDKV